MLGTAAVFACGSSSDNASSSGSTSGSAASPDDARTFFDSKVYSPLAQTCDQCHQTGKNGAPVFLGANAEASYTAIEGFPGLIALPSLSPLLQKGVHSGPALTQAQNDVVTKWLSLEVTARKLGSDPGAPKNLRAAFKAFGDCMDYSRWKQLKLHTIAVTDTQNNQGQCRSCHNYGMASLWLAGGTDKPTDEADNAITFVKFTQFPYVQRLVIGRVKDGRGDTTDNREALGTFDGIEPSRRLIDKGSEAQQQQANSHPRFALSSDLAANLTQFVQETISNMNSGQCQGMSTPDAGSYDAAAVIPRKF